MSTAKKQSQQRLIEWRRSQILEYISKGYNQSAIAKMLKVNDVMVCRDLNAIAAQSKNNIKKYIEDKLPNEYEKCLVGITSILRESWNMSQEPDIERREKLQALSLAKECYITKLELLTNANVLNDAVKFVSSHQQQQQQQQQKHKQDSIRRISTTTAEEQNNSESDKPTSDNNNDDKAIVEVKPEDTAEVF